MDRRTFLGLALVSPYAVSAAASASTESPDDLHELLASQRESSGLPGVMKQGRLLALGAVGVRKAGMEAAVTRDDKFHIGSDTKAMTATLAAMPAATRATSSPALFWRGSRAKRGKVVGKLVQRYAPECGTSLVLTTSALAARNRIFGRAFPCSRL